MYVTKNQGEWILNYWLYWKGRKMIRNWLSHSSGIWNQANIRAMLSSKALGKILSLPPFKFRWLSAFIGLWPHHFYLCLCHHVSHLPLPLIMAVVIKFWDHSGHQGWSPHLEIFNYIYKYSFPNMLTFIASGNYGIKIYFQCYHLTHYIKFDVLMGSVL